MSYMMDFFEFLFLVSFMISKCIVSNFEAS